MANDHVPLPEGQVPVEEFWAKVTAGELPEGATLQDDGTVLLSDGSTVDKDGVRTLPTGNVLFPCDEFGLVDIIDASGLTAAWVAHRDKKVDAAGFWALIDEEVKRDPRLAEDAKLFEQDIPRPASAS